MPETDVIPTSASVASTGKGIRYIGDYAYAYSGLFAASTAVTTELEFITGSGLIKGEFQLNAPVSTTSTQAAIATIYFNEIEIAIIKVTFSTSSAGFPGSERQPVIIPPRTKIKVTVDSTDDQSGQQGSVTFVGRVYGAE